MLHGRDQDTATLTTCRCCARSGDSQPPSTPKPPRCTKNTGCRAATRAFKQPSSRIVDNHDQRAAAQVKIDGFLVPLCPSRCQGTDGGALTSRVRSVPDCILTEERPQRPTSALQFTVFPVLIVLLSDILPEFLIKSSPSQLGKEDTSGPNADAGYVNCTVRSWTRTRESQTPCSLTNKAIVYNFPKIHQHRQPEQSGRYPSDNKPKKVAHLPAWCPT